MKKLKIFTATLAITLLLFVAMGLLVVMATLWVSR